MKESHTKKVLSQSALSPQQPNPAGRPHHSIRLGICNTVVQSIRGVVFVYSAFRVTLEITFSSAPSTHPIYHANIFTSVRYLWYSATLSYIAAFYLTFCIERFYNFC